MSFTIVATIFVLVSSTSCRDEEIFEKNETHPVVIKHEEKVPIIDAIGVAGSAVRLPCDLSMTLPGDKVHLVLWYKEGDGSKVGVRAPLIPVYSLDARGEEEGGADDRELQPQHWADVTTWGGRAHFQRESPVPALAIDSLRDRDAGVYRCRVDFKRSPTRNSRVNLTVIIPPERLSVVDANGVHIQHYILGPYAEGASLDIACIATGGRPTPRVTWWQENALLDDSWETLTERSVRNILRIDRLERRHLNTVFTCQASNNNIVAPISSSVTLDLNLSPLWVRLLGENRPVSASHSQETKCESVGGRPPPHITWWKGNRLLLNSTQETSADGNRTVSTVRFTPTIDDTTAVLKCRATSPYLLHDPPLEDSWPLNVRHLPVVSLEMGGGSDSRFVREGSEVSLDCIVSANPWVYRVAWKHNGRLLYDDGNNDGLEFLNQSLIIRNVGRGHEGAYSCVASNQEGDEESDQLFLNVKFAPVCRPGQQTLIGAGRLEPVQVTCEVEADPDEVTFSWSTSSKTIAEDMLRFDVERTRSTLTITLMTSFDFGNLSCWASNVLGKQRQPCVFLLVPAGRPEAVSNCSVVNQTEDGLSLEVECLEGFDGGLGQSFALELYDGDSLQLLRNLTSPSPTKPRFLLDPLPAADSRRLHISVYAFNAKGRSPPTLLQVYNANKAERRTAAVTVKLTPLIGALIGMIGALILIVLAVALALYLRSRECPPPSKGKVPSLDSLENNPDIINNCNGHEDEEEKDVGRLLRENVQGKVTPRPVSRPKSGIDLEDSKEEDSILRTYQSSPGLEISLEF